MNHGKKEMGHGGKHMMSHGGKHMMPGGGMYKRMSDGGKAKNRLMQYLASGGMMPMDPKMAEHGMRITDGGVMVKIMPLEDGGAVKKMTHGGVHEDPIISAARKAGKAKIAAMESRDKSQAGRARRANLASKSTTQRLVERTGAPFMKDSQTGQPLAPQSMIPRGAVPAATRFAGRRRSTPSKTEVPNPELKKARTIQTRKGNKGLKALAAKNPELKYVGKNGMKMPGGGHVFKKAQEGTKVQGNPRAEAEAQVKLRQANIARLKKEKAGIQAGGSSTGAKALAGDDKFKSLVGLSNISSSAVSKLHAGYDALIAAEQKQLAGAMKAAKRPPMLKKGDMAKAMARAAKQ